LAKGVPNTTERGKSSQGLANERSHTAQENNEPELLRRELLTKVDSVQGSAHFGAHQATGAKEIAALSQEDTGECERNKRMGRPELQRDQAVAYFLIN
jgi:hypothetical protein